jgi:hypothetical protein
MAKRERTKGQTMFYKTIHRKLNPRVYSCFGKVSSSSSTCGPHHDTLVTKSGDKS